MKIKKIIICIILLLLVIGLIFFRNLFIINKIFSAQEQYSNITDYHYIAEDINGKTDVYQNKNYILVNINNGNSITLKNFNTGKAKLYSKETNSYIEADQMALENFYFNAYISRYANKNDIFKKYLITPIKIVDNCYVINIDNFTYYINTETLLVNKYENNDGTYLLSIHCDFEEITDDIFNIDFDNL